MNKLLKGFYYNFKHDPQKGAYDYAYFIMEVPSNDVDNIDVPKVSYLRLYSSPNIYSRSLSEFGEDVNDRKENVTKQPIRFMKIEDTELCAKLKERFYEMYPDLLP